MRKRQLPVIAAVILNALGAVPAVAQLTGLRNATAYVRVPEDAAATLTVSYQGVWAWQHCFDTVHVQAPDGSLIGRTRIEAGVGEGEETYSLDRGPGDYRVSFSGYTYRAFALATEPRLPMVFQAPPVHTAISNYAPQVLYFHVPQGTESFTFCIKNQDRRPLGVSLAPPGGAEATDFEATEIFRGLKSRATMRQERDYFHNWEYDTREIEAPTPGVWTVRFDHVPKASVWLEGIPDYFAIDPEALFVPELGPGRANLEVDATRVAGPVGMLGASFPTPRNVGLVDERIRFLRLQSLCKYQSHALREPKNDDNDPHHINPAGFNWGPEDERYDAAARWGAEPLVIIQPAGWLGGREKLLLGSDENLEEYAEFVEALLTHYNVERETPIRYLSLMDEPNSAYDVEQVERLVRVVGHRLQAHPDERVRATQLMAPQSSMFFKYADGLDRAGVTMAERLYNTCDGLVGGIAWDHWTYRNLFDTWLYGEAVSRAAEIQEQFDTDGEKQEAIAIFQTNFYGGGSISFQDTRTFYASLWWASVVANAMKTGRMTSLNWFTTFDDPHHMKGLCYAQEEGGEVKPVGYAMRMLIEALLDDAVASTGDHPEVDEIATISADRQHLNLLVVNKLARQIALKASIDLPSELSGRGCRLSVSRMADGDESLRLLDGKEVAVGESIPIERDLQGESIYVFGIQATEDQ